MRVHLHVHATTGVTMVSLMKAIEAGADCVDTAISSLSLGPGHNPTESLVEMLEGTPFDTRLDKARLLKLKRYFNGIRPRYREFLSNITGVETEIFDSQIPGGMLSNMESQLKQQGAGNRIDEVMAEVPNVRKDAGFPPLVTPSSQIVGTQAVFNVLMGRYKVMTGEFADLMLGYYGECIGERNPEVVEIAIEGVMYPDELHDEGPYGEFSGYYASGERTEPIIKVKRLMHRNNPILTGAPSSRPPGGSDGPPGGAKGGACVGALPW